MPSSTTNLFKPAPTTFERFLASPVLFLAKWLYSNRPYLLPPVPGSPPIRIVCISDTHNQTPVLPAGDILIHAGDMCINGTSDELAAQIAWMDALDYKHKIVIAGNHDVCLATPSQSPSSNTPQSDTINWGSLTYLNNASTTIRIKGRTLKVYGSPYTPQYGNWAFQYPPHRARINWHNTVPIDTDVLVTHGPARGHLDLDAPSLGCRELLKEVRRVRPRLHVCGHVHAGRGREVVDWSSGERGGSAVQAVFEGPTKWGKGVQSRYDRICMGEGGLWTLSPMLVGWCWEWIVWAAGVKMRGTAEVVNAAMREVGSGEDGTVVEI